MEFEIYKSKNIKFLFLMICCMFTQKYLMASWTNNVDIYNVDTNNKKKYFIAHFTKNKKVK
jgi:hypothetical protein